MTPERVKATQAAVNSYFAGMEKQINAGTAQYESGKKELEESRKQLDTYKSELEKAEKLGIEIIDENKFIEMLQSD